jgi:hypothetical protein
MARGVRKRQPDQVGRRRGMQADTRRPGSDSVIGSVIWMAVITAVFAPLAISRYRHRV